DENIILSIFKMKFITDMSSSKNAALFFNHTIGVVIFSFAIANTKDLQEKTKFTEGDIADLLKAAFFHNMGGICELNSFISSGENERLKKYTESNRSSGFMLNSIPLSFDVLDAVRYSGEYYFDRFDFVDRYDNKGCWYANIIVTADMYVRMETGLFGVHKKPSLIIDNLNLQASESKLNKEVVKAFTLGMNLTDIFDFYSEIDKLKKLCDFEDGKHTWPYPMTGFQSPTIFVCMSDKENCDHYEKTVKAVSLVKRIGKLSEGMYARCLLTSPKLQEFYKEHYDEIKEDTKDPSANN
ncbi:hypothetical protein ACFL7D_09325, partial [candidate division KSB1 bacterium]